MMADAERRARMSELLDMIDRNREKSCPDSIQGGCMGHYCTACAVKALRSHVKQLGAP